MISTGDLSLTCPGCGDNVRVFYYSDQLWGLTNAGAANCRGDFTNHLAAIVDSLAETQHDAYERAAMITGWETQQALRKPWSEVPDANKMTMRHSVAALLTVLVGGPR